MHRRPLGNGRRLAVVGAVLLIVGCVLPWYVLGGDGGLPRQVYRAFDGTGIISFFAGLGTLALVALPYAAGERPVAIDRALSFALLAVAAVIGVLLWIPQANVLDAPGGLLPNQAFGYWIAALGAIVLARAAYDIWLEPPRR
jgi:hypothetical protein